MFNNMPEKSDDDSNLFWGAVDFALAQLSVEFKEPSVNYQPVTENFIKYKKDISFVKYEKDINCSGDTIPVVIPVSSDETAKSGGGVNHLNLIQIKGKPAHSWQPRVMHDNVRKFIIYRPSLYDFEVNKILLKTVITKNK